MKMYRVMYYDKNNEVKTYCIRNTKRQAEHVLYALLSGNVKAWIEY